MDEQFDLKMYIDILKRRKWLFIIPSALVLIAAVGVASVLPPVYKSEATIMVEAQEIPEEMVQSTVTGYVEDRLQTIKQIVLSRDNLLGMIERFNLYPDMKETGTSEQMVRAMRQAFSLRTVNTEVRGKGSATIAFVLSFEGRNPRTVARVANSLASQFIEENARQREQRAETTVDFLNSQLSKLEGELRQTEQRIANFKDKNLHALPEYTDFNLGILQRLQERMDSKRNEIKNLLDRKAFLKDQLASFASPEAAEDPETGTSSGSPSQRLEQLWSDYLAKKDELSRDHPEVVNLKEDIMALEQRVGNSDELRRLREQLLQEEYRLTELKERYSDKHPDVIQARKRVQTLEERVQDMFDTQPATARTSGSSGGSREAAEGQGPMELNSRLRSIEMEVSNARQELRDLQGKYQAYQQRIEKAPRVEQQYKALQRDYANLKSEYQETKARLMEAREAQELEKSRVSQKLRIINPPVVPGKPSEPNRLAILLVGAVLASGFGVGTGSLAEIVDKSLHSAKGLGSISPRPVLVAIPYIQTRRDRRKRLIKRLLLVFGTLAALMAILVSLHLYFRPLDHLLAIMIERWKVFF